MSFGRRELMLGGLGLGAALAAGPKSAAAAQQAPQPSPLGDSFGLVAAEGRIDQTASLQDAINRAGEANIPLHLPAGTFLTGPLQLRPGLQIAGIPGKTALRLLKGNALLAAEALGGIRLSGLTLSGDGAAMDEDAALLQLVDIDGFEIADCRILESPQSGILLRRSSGRVTRCEIAEIADTAIFSSDAKGLEIASNEIRDCGDNGIQIWRTEPGEDGSLVLNNRIERVKASSGGSGQYGNGINLYRAGAVTIANNRITDCTYSAIRDNSGANCQILGNSCARLGETAIFVEFAFDGAIVANNVIDTAALGISLTNFDKGGRLGVVQGNLIRNIFFRKQSDSKGIGIAVEADCNVTGNVVEKVAGYGLALGWYRYLRDVAATGNLIRDCHIGIAVSATPDAGYALITDNMISGSKDGAIRAMDGPKPLGPDLATASAEAYRNLAVYSNVGI